jgi:hypothetical protein
MLSSEDRRRAAELIESLAAKWAESRELLDAESFDAYRGLRQEIDVITAELAEILPPATDPLS